LKKYHNFLSIILKEVSKGFSCLKISAQKKPEAELRVLNCN
jgi:hypothetical protein